MSELPLFSSAADWRCRWLVLDDGRDNDFIHRIECLDLNEWVNNDECAASGTAVCGLEGWFAIPGIFTRMGGQRCPECCDRLGIPHGDGAPYNEGIDEPCEGRFSVGVTPTSEIAFSQPIVDLLKQVDVCFASHQVTHIPRLALDHSLHLVVAFMVKPHNLEVHVRRPGFQTVSTQFHVTNGTAEKGSAQILFSEVTA